MTNETSNNRPNNCLLTHLLRISAVLNEIVQLKERGFESTSMHEADSSSTPPLFTLLPDGYRLPSVTTFNAFSLWYMGDAKASVRPLRFVQGSQLEDKRDRKNFCHWRYLMNHLHTLIRNKAPGLIASLQSRPTQEFVNEMWDAISDDLPIAPPQSNRNRRIGQLKVRTVANLVRESTQDRAPKRRRET